MVGWWCVSLVEVCTHILLLEKSRNKGNGKHKVTHLIPLNFTVDNSDIYSTITV